MGSSIQNKVAPVPEKNDLWSVFKYGDIFTKLSFVVFGLSNIVRGQFVKGFAYLALEIAYIYYMITAGVANLGGLATLGTKQQSMQINQTTGIIEVVQGDNSMLILLWGVVTVIISAAFICLWLVQIYSGEAARRCRLKGKKAPSIIDDIKALFDGNIHKLLLAIPVVGLVVFTVLRSLSIWLTQFCILKVKGRIPIGSSER